MTIGSRPMTSPAITDKISAHLNAHGYEGRVNTGCYGCVRHSCGLPRMPCVSVKPTFSPVDGSHVVLVTAEEVSGWTVACPYNYSNWTCYKRTPYSTPDDMLAAVARLADEPKGCWT